MPARAGLLASLAVLAASTLVANRAPLAEAHPPPPAAACQVKAVRSPLTPTEAGLVFGRWGQPPVMAPNGDMYFAPTLTSGAIEELDRRGQVVWQYALPRGDLVAWAATGTDLVLLRSQLDTTTLMTINLATHALATTNVPNPLNYGLVASADAIVLVGTPNVPSSNPESGMVMVLGGSGGLVRRWTLPSDWMPGSVSATAYGARIYLVAQLNASAAPSAPGAVDYAVDEIVGPSIRPYTVDLRLARAAYQAVAPGRILFYRVNPGSVNAIASVTLGDPARVDWRTEGPVGVTLGTPSVVAYGTTGYVAGDVEPMLSVPAWRLDLATGRRLGAMHLPGYAVYPAVAGPWGLIALAQRGGSGNPVVAVFSPDGALRLMVQPNQADQNSATSTQGFVMQSGSDGGGWFLSSALPADVALALPAACGAG